MSENQDWGRSFSEFLRAPTGSVLPPITPLCINGVLAMGAEGARGMVFEILELGGEKVSPKYLVPVNASEEHNKDKGLSL